MDTKTYKQVRLEAITKLINRRFTLYSPLKETLDTGGHFCYKNNEMTIYDCLFYLNILTCLDEKFSICKYYMRKGYNLKGNNI